MFKRFVSYILVLVMVIGLLPGFTISFAASAEDDDISNMNALDALGIDTSVPPEGFDPNSTEIPTAETSYLWPPYGSCTLSG